MKVFSVPVLWSFINRSETLEQIQIAEDFISKLDYLDIDVYHDMMNSLAFKVREFYRESR